MDIYYQNHAGEKIYLDRRPYRMLAVTTLFDSEWDYITKGYNFPRVVQFEKSMVIKSFDIVIDGATKEEYRNNADSFAKITERDIRELTPGKLYVGNTYLSCYFYKSQKKRRYVNTNKAAIQIGILSESGKWIYENKFQIRNAFESTMDQQYLDYPHGYNYDYANILSSRMIHNNSPGSSDFKMIVYGPCTDPVIAINDHVYQIYAEIMPQEYLVVDSVEKKIYKVKNNGMEINLFGSRNRDSYIFQKIAVGKNSVVWSGEYGFDLILYEERGEPKWI